MARHGRSNFFDDRPTAAEQVREAAARFARGDVGAYARQEAKRLQELKGEREARRRDIQLELDINLAIGREPSHATPEAVGACLLMQVVEEVVRLEGAYSVPAIGEADRRPPRPNFPLGL